MAFHLLNLFLSAGASSEAATSSAVGMIGSFLAAGALVVAPAAAASASTLLAALAAAFVGAAALHAARTHKHNQTFK